MKSIILKFGWALTRIGDKYNIRILTYNPITWAFFLASGYRGGRIFAKVVREIFPEVRSAIDVGAGSGGYVCHLRKSGIEAVGVEYSVVGRVLGRLQGATMLPFDCSQHEPSKNVGRFDLSFSIEVGEHLPTDLSAKFVEFIAERSDLVIFSAAHKGQGGHGHINEQSKEFWADLFEEKGFKKSTIMELEIVNSLKRLSYKGWLPINLQVFTKIPLE
jgi:hypothetical protein